MTKTVLKKQSQFRSQHVFHKGFSDSVPPQNLRQARFSGPVDRRQTINRVAEATPPRDANVGAGLWATLAATVSSLPLSKRIAILGSTGSIGCAAVDVIEHLGPPYRAVALSGHSNCDALIAQAKKLRPEIVAVTAECDRAAIEDQLHHLGCETFFGPTALTEIATHPDVDAVLSAVVGAAGLPAAIATVRAGKPLLLANKESLVVAGEILMREAHITAAPILPVDSEHSAVFQAMQSGRRNEIRRVILTASGGPFRNWPADKIESATPADALKHPVWQMGSKITIDSATMFNKAAEILEAIWLFGLEPQQVEVVIHPESVVHSMVEFCDGSTIAQLSPPNMRLPIQYAMTYPERCGGCGPRLDLTKSFSLNFQPPDFERFPALRIAFDVARRGGTLGAVMNAANEVAVEAFLRGRTSFGSIARTVEETIARHTIVQKPALSDLLAADHWARAEAAKLLTDAAETEKLTGATAK